MFIPSLAYSELIGASAVPQDPSMRAAPRRKFRRGAVILPSRFSVEADDFDLLVVDGPSLEADEVAHAQPVELVHRGTG